MYEDSVLDTDRIILLWNRFVGVLLLYLRLSNTYIYICIMLRVYTCSRGSSMETNQEGVDAKVCF